MWFQNRRAKFRRNERSALSQSKPLYNNSGSGNKGGSSGSSSTTSSSLIGGNVSLVTSNGGMEDMSSVKHAGENEQSKSIEQPVLPKSISQIGGKIKKMLYHQKMLLRINIDRKYMLLFIRKYQTFVILVRNI